MQNNTKEGIKPVNLKCAKCGYVLKWKPTIWSYVPHEPKPLTCPKCGSIEWEEEDANNTNQS